MKYDKTEMKARIEEIEKQLAILNAEGIILYEHVNKLMKLIMKLQVYHLYPAMTGRSSKLQAVRSSSEDSC